MGARNMKRIILLLPATAMAASAAPRPASMEMLVERLPAIVILSFRELGDATDGVGASMADPLTAWFFNDAGFRYRL